KFQVLEDAWAPTSVPSPFLALLLPSYTSEVDQILNWIGGAGDTHMRGSNLITHILGLACFMIQMPGFGIALADDVMTSMALVDVKSSIAALKAETAKLGPPEVAGIELYFGKTKASNDVVDAVVKKLGGEAMLFRRSGDQYVRVATTLNNADHKSAVGTSLD